MDVLKHFLTAIGLIAAVVTILPEISSFKLSTKKVTVTSGILTILSIIGLWLIDAMEKTPIRNVSGSVIIGVRWKDNGHESYSMGFEPSSTIEIYANNECLIKVGSSKTETKGTGKGGMIFRNEYSLSTRGSYIKASLEDILEIDSLIIYDMDLPEEIEAVDGYAEIKIDGDRYKVVVTPSRHLNRRIKFQSLELDSIKI